MKIIHFADLHIGSKFNRLDEETKEKLETELRNTFSRIIVFAYDNNINQIIMAGDIFDKNTVNFKDKKFFYDLIKENKNITFYYLKGNHDLNSKYIEKLDNLKTFDEYKTYYLDNVTISGYELKDDNRELYNILPLNKQKFNILILHGDINNKNDDNYINLDLLKEKNINYFALGHIHKRDEGFIDSSKYAYPGCVMGRGFDEVGEKGFLVLDTDTNKTEFIKFGKVIFEVLEINVTQLKNEVQLKKEIENKLGDKDICKVTKVSLIGKTNKEIDEEDIKELDLNYKDYRLFITFEDKTTLKSIYQKQEKENSLINIFINKVLSKGELSEEEKQEIIEYGKSKLMKEER